MIVDSAVSMLVRQKKGTCVAHITHRNYFWIEGHQLQIHRHFISSPCVLRRKTRQQKSLGATSCVCCRLQAAGKVSKGGGIKISRWKPLHSEKNEANSQRAGQLFSLLSYASQVPPSPSIGAVGGRMHTSLNDVQRQFLRLEWLRSRCEPAVLAEKSEASFAAGLGRRPRAAFAGVRVPRHHERCTCCCLRRPSALSSLVPKRYERERAMRRAGLE